MLETDVHMSACTDMDGGDTTVCSRHVAGLVACARWSQSSGAVVLVAGVWYGLGHDSQSVSQSVGRQDLVFV